MKLIRYILIVLVVISSSYGKKDFYYNFVDEDLSQISQTKKNKILGSNDKLKMIRRYINEGQLNLALKQIEMFKATNKIPLLTSLGLLMNAEILYKINTKTRLEEGAKLLEEAINSSKINSEDLLDAYRQLVLLKISINKPKEALYYANAIENSFDNPLQKVYSKVAHAQIYVKQREYRKAIKILRKALVDTTSLEVATIIADELYDAYILNHQHKEAFDLVEKVLNKNIDYYANDSYRALKKVNKLIKADMTKFAIEILKKLIKNSKEKKSIDNFKFILANTYMHIAGFQPQYLSKAKKIYEELIKRKDNNPYLKRSKMYLDEIIMREGKFEPAMLAAKYSDSDPMQYKAMMQELLNAIEDEQYEQIIRMKKVYSGIYPNIVKRFGYESIDQIYNEVNAKMIKYYLNTKQCKQLNVVIKDVKDDVMLMLLEDQKSIDNLFECLAEVPDKRAYTIVKNIYNKAKNSIVYFYLEQIAIQLDKYDDAFKFSQKLDMLSDNKILSDEFLYRFLIYFHTNNEKSMQQFFGYARQNPEFIKNNKNNPMIIDFYYNYYKYLLKENEEDEAVAVLNELYKKQNEMKARVYSPFVEIELARYAKLDDNYDLALKYYKYGLNIKRMKDGQSIDRKIDPKDLAHIYYEMAKIYEYKNKKNRYKNIIKRCQRLKNVDSYYKKLCDKM
jgi:hypothetical protein